MKFQTSVHQPWSIKTVKMFRFVVLAVVVATANAGLIQAPLGAVSLAAPLAAAPAVSVASGPALGATLLGRTTVTAPETTIVKQPVIVDQPEIRYRAVPTLVQPAPVVQTVAAPVVRTIAAPVQTVVQAPAVRTVSLQAPAVQTVAVQAPALRTVSLQAPAIQTVSLQAPALRTIAAPAPIAVQANTIQTIATPLAANQLITGLPAATWLGAPANTLLASPTVLALKK